MASWQERPYTGASVWCLQHGNGKIEYIDHSLGMVYCDFYSNGHHPIELDDFDGSFDERLNQFIIAPL